MVRSKVLYDVSYIYRMYHYYLFSVLSPPRFSASLSIKSAMSVLTALRSTFPLASTGETVRRVADPTTKAAGAARD